MESATIGSLRADEKPHLSVDHPVTVLWAMLVAASTVMAAVTIAIPALPSIGRELLTSQTELQ